MGLALWLRVTSLGTLPVVNGDEAFFGIQAVRVIHGLAPLRTPTGNPANPFLVGTEAPLVWTFGTGPWVVRIPAAAAGVLAVVLTFVWGRRWADSPTALIAATALAVLPIAIVFSRVAIESCSTPLFAVVALHQAFLGRRLGLLAAFAACLLMHPTNIFLGPVLVGVYLGRVLPATQRWHRWRILVQVALGGAAVVVGFCLLVVGRGSAEVYRRLYYRPPDWPAFLRSFGRFLLGNPVYTAAPLPVFWVRAFDVVFWASALGMVAVGGRALVRARRWDQLGLIAGLPLSVAGLHLMAGSAVFSPAFNRYGAFLIVPTALALAFLTRETLFTRPSVGVGGSAAPHARPAAACVALGVAGIMLGVVRAHFFAPCELATAPIESVWTPWAESVSPLERAYAAVAADLAQTSPRDGRAVGVIADDWWLAKPFEFLAGGRRDVRVVSYDTLYWSLPPDRLRGYLERRIREGDFVLTMKSQRGLRPLATDVEAIVPASRLECRRFGPLMLRRLREGSGPEPWVAVGDGPHRR
jgi:4-amino-4-deoxy-L-arabinose transferase-like glycosyltransferase